MTTTTISYDVASQPRGDDPDPDWQPIASCESFEQALTVARSYAGEWGLRFRYAARIVTITAEEV